MESCPFCFFLDNFVFDENIHIFNQSGMQIN